MVESQLRTLFEELVSEPPPSRVDIGLARNRGRSRRRWRRAGVAGAPALAAAAVAAVILTTSVIPGMPGHGPAIRPAAAGPARAPNAFNPLVPYATFGWLPSGTTLMSGGTSRSTTSLVALTGPGGTGWTLQVFSAGRCQLTAKSRQLDCAYSADGGILADVIGPAPAVNGRRALWVSGYLAWQYARGGWALLSFPSLHGNRGEIGKVAEHIRYAVATAPAIAFPAQLRNVPRQWQVSSVHFVRKAGVLGANGYTLSAGPVDLGPGDGEFSKNVPFLTTQPATSSKCYFYSRGRSRHEQIRGYQVVVTHLPASHGSAPMRQVCAADAGGLTVDVTVTGWRPAMDPVTLFKDHLRLLGTNPRNWTTKPLG